MTELAMREDTTDNLPVLGSDAFDRLAAWARAAEATYQLATRLVETSFVPEAFRKKPHEATAAILAGTELGFDPMASLRCFDVIQGSASPKAITLRAVVQSKGHEIWEEDCTDEKAVVKGRRKGESRIHTSEWTIKRAQDLGLLSKHNWKAQRGAMLLARATSECARLTASDAILGIPYSSEELADMDEPIRGEITVAPKVTAAEILGTEPEPEPEAELVEDLPARDKASTKQVGLLQMLCAEDADTGSEKSRRLFVVGRIVGRGIKSFNDLTSAEASVAIQAFEEKKRRTPKPAEPVQWDDVEIAQPPLVGE